LPIFNSTATRPLQPAMEEKQIEVKVLAADDHALLACDKGKTAA
jgi:hypothetical protein